MNIRPRSEPVAKHVIYESTSVTHHLPPLFVLELCTGEFSLGTQQRIAEAVAIGATTVLRLPNGLTYVHYAVDHSQAKETVRSIIDQLIQTPRPAFIGWLGPYEADPPIVSREGAVA